MGLVSFVPVMAKNMMAYKVALIINEGCEPQWRPTIPHMCKVKVIGTACCNKCSGSISFCWIWYLLPGTPVSLSHITKIPCKILFFNLVHVTSL